MHTFKNKVSIRIGNEAVDGFLSFTSERVLFSREDDDKEETSWKAFQIYFKSVCVHAIESLVVHASPEEARRKGERAAADVRRRFAPETVAREVTRHVKRLAREWREERARGAEREL